MDDTNLRCSYKGFQSLSDASHLNAVLFFFLPSPTTTRKVVRYEMFLLAALSATFLFFSGFAAAQISAPDCSLSWEWVCFSKTFYKFPVAS